MLAIVRQNVVDLPTNLSLRYLWCGGFMIRRFLVLQLGSGIILSLIYVADSEMRFGCVLEFTGESIFVWFVRYLHIWGVTFIFVLFLVHMGRALYYSSYRKVGV
jgi:ubiquinol-cytochrome c reductase cytochrome b subunit